jgi:hypothetical protein
MPALFPNLCNPYALKCHISDKHQYIAEDEGEISRSNIPYDELGLWDEDLPTEEPSFWDEDFSTEDQMVRS